MPSSSTSRKSIERSNFSSAANTSCATPSAFSPTIASDRPSAVAITPIAVGKPTKRWFTYASSAVMTRQRAMMSSIAQE